MSRAMAAATRSTRGPMNDTSSPPTNETANVRCRCGASHSVETFERLPLVETLDARALGGIVLRWPSGQEIRVRACSACGAGLARLARA